MASISAFGGNTLFLGVLDYHHESHVSDLLVIGMDWVPALRRVMPPKSSLYLHVE